GAAIPNRISLSEMPRTAGPDDGGVRAAVVVGGGAGMAVGADGAATAAADVADGAAVAATAQAVGGGAEPGGSSAGRGEGGCGTAETARVGLAASCSAEPVGRPSLASL